MKLPGTTVEIDDRLTPLLVPIDEVQPDSMNPRTVVNLERLVRRIERYGFTDPIVANRNTNVIAAGHMRHAACRELGATHVPVIYVDHDHVQARAFNIAHNRSSEDVAAWEPEALAELLSALKEEDEFFDLVGFDDDDIAALLGTDDPTPDTTSSDGIPETTAEDDEIPEPPPEPITKLGETIELGHHRVYCGDCMELLASLPDNSIDAVVTDPPYGLSEEPDVADVLRHWLDGKAYEHGGAGFMNKKWDSFVPGPHVWREVLRVLKPGGHVLASFGTRTYHLGATAVALAGFETRDQIEWLYGQGFPKSLDVSKAIDKSLGAEREIIGRQKTPGGMLEQMSDPEGVAGGNRWTGIVYGGPVTDDAKRWTGWGTALKPAHEPFVLARKPLAGNVAENVLEHGVGGINVDGCRGRIEDDGLGRWPANVALDEIAAAMLDEQSGVSVSRRSVGRNGKDAAAATFGLHRTRDDARGHNDSGGASRFFYTAKATKAERDEGLDDMPTHDASVTVGREPGSAGTQNPRAGAGRNGGRKNIHPTVKPVSLMRWLLKLITPPGGTVLDPFCGSGTTIVAAVPMGFRVVGAELEPLHCDIIRARVAAALDRHVAR